MLVDKVELGSEDEAIAEDLMVASLKAVNRDYEAFKRAVDGWSAQSLEAMKQWSMRNSSANPPELGP